MFVLCSTKILKKKRKGEPTNSYHARHFPVSTGLFPKKFLKYRGYGVYSPCLIIIFGISRIGLAGADPGFFLGGGAPLRNDVTDW